MPIDQQQIETALAIQSEMIAGLYRWQIGQGLLSPAEYRDMLATAQGDRDVDGRLFVGPLRPLYRVAPLR